MMTLKSWIRSWRGVKRTLTLKQWLKICKAVEEELNVELCDKRMMDLDLGDEKVTLLIRVDEKHKRVYIRVV